MNIITKTISPVVVLGILGFGALNGDAQAAKITGTIGLGGNATLNSPSLLTATQVSNWGPVMVFTSTLDFAANGVAMFDTVTMNAPWVFAPSPGLPLTALWSVDGFTFDLTSSSVNTQTSTFLDITGYGIVKRAGFDDTEGLWAFSITNSGGGAVTDAKFTFSASASVVPDGGSSVALLGLALAGVQLIRRKVTGGLPA